MKNKVYSGNEKKEILHFDQHALNYDDNYNYNQGFTKHKILKKTNAFIDIIKNHRNVNKRKKIKILEIGCGTGEYTKIIAKKLPYVQFYCLDISPKIIAVAKKKCKKIKNVKFFVLSAFDTGFKTEMFDFVFGYYILHHISLKKVTKEICRVLKKNGKAFFYEPNLLNPYVFLVKSIPFLKKLAGDSPDEWAINPLTVSKMFKGFQVKVKYSEFVYPFSFIPTRVMLGVDKILSVASNIPGVKYFGGSVSLELQKNG